MSAVGIAAGHVRWGEQYGVAPCQVSWWHGEGAWWNNVTVKTWCGVGGLCLSAPRAGRRWNVWGGNGL